MFHPSQSDRTVSNQIASPDMRYGCPPTCVRLFFFTFLPFPVGGPFAGTWALEVAFISLPPPPLFAIQHHGVWACFFLVDLASACPDPFSPPRLDNAKAWKTSRENVPCNFVMACYECLTSRTYLLPARIAQHFSRRFFSFLS